MDPRQEEDLKKEVEYYRRQLDKLSGESVRHDYLVVTLRQELKQKKDAFAVLSVLQQSFSVTTPLEELLEETIKAINKNLGMERSVVLRPAGDFFELAHFAGYPVDFFHVNPKRGVVIPGEYLHEVEPLLVNKSTGSNDFIESIQQNFSINYFIANPIIHDQKVVAVIIAGRQLERRPFSPPLDKGDVDSLQAIASLIKSILEIKKGFELQLAKTKVEEENEAIAKQRDLLEQALTELKNAQNQLVQSEKMASLGELTAGIAHEIQNPLNFVNNFSEVNMELVVELETEILEGNKEEALKIAGDIRGNQDKILHHGKRADAIVKSMLQHSRKSSGKKEPVDINELADEYVRLAYHGLRAKDNSVTVKLETQYDPSVGKINVDIQEIGRVLLNLVNNAFYAAIERKKQAGTGFESKVLLKTKKIAHTLEIQVNDNGNGIPPAILEKIFQPFFTTKPTGQGTGLGLSLSYDIVKAHGGELKVETREGEGTTFIIVLPV